jgi:hypothetical protein
METSNYKYNSGIDVTKEIVFEVNNKVKRVYWTNEEIDKWFGKRSAKEILDDGTTCFMNPCWDLTVVSASELLSRKINYIFAIEEHKPTPGFNFNRLHFVLEFQYKNKNYFLNYKKANEVYVYEGNYNGREDIPMAQIIRVPGKEINPKKPIYKSLGYDNLEDLIKDKFKGYSLESNLNRLKRDNSKENYDAYKKAFGDDLILITTPQNPPSL